MNTDALINSADNDQGSDVPFAVTPLQGMGAREAATSTGLFKSLRRASAAGSPL
jgi:hypothetical protein